MKIYTITPDEFLAGVKIDRKTPKARHNEAIRQSLEDSKLTVITLYGQGWGVNRLADRFKCNPKTIYNYLLKWGITLRDDKQEGDALIRDSLASVVKVLREANHSLNAISRHLKINPHRVKRICVENDIPLPTRCRHDRVGGKKVKKRGQ